MFRLQQSADDGEHHRGQTGAILPCGVRLVGRNVPRAGRNPVREPESRGRRVVGRGAIFNLQKVMIMETNRQIFRASVVVALGTVQIAPCLLMLGSTIIALVLGVAYTAALAYFWSSTIIGRRFFRAFYRSTLRLENYIFPPLGNR